MKDLSSAFFLLEIHGTTAICSPLYQHFIAVCHGAPEGVWSLYELDADGVLL